MKKLNKLMVDVSTVIPCYNCVDTIERAIASISEQTVLPAEVILVNDCSTDGTIELLKKIQSRYSDGWIRVIDLKRNGGPGEARNAGWSAARQNYIAFLDADDAWHPQKIEIQYGWMSNNQHISISGHESIKYGLGIQSPSLQFVIESIPYDEISKNCLLFKNHLPTRSVMLRRDVPQRFSSHMRYSEDYSLWLKIVCAGQLMAKINLPLSYSFKPDFASAGLSSNLWKMQMGELNAYREIVGAAQINSAYYFLLVGWSWIRFLRRLAVAKFIE